MNVDTKRQAWFLFFLLCVSPRLTAQNLILNGSFETNNLTSSTGSTHLADQFNSWISDVFYVSGWLQLVTSDFATCTAPVDGNWMISDLNDESSGTFGFRLSQPLTAMHTYQLTFSYHSCVGYMGFQQINIALSNDSAALFQNTVASIIPVNNTVWNEAIITFASAIDETYLKVNLIDDGMVFNSGLHADNFVLTDVTTGIMEPAINAVEVYTNPVSSQTQLFYNLPPGTHDASICMYDVVGNMVSEVSLPQNQHAITLDVSRFASGIYFCQLIADEKILLSKKLIVTR